MVGRRLCVPHGGGSTVLDRRYRAFEGVVQHRSWMRGAATGESVRGTNTRTCTRTNLVSNHGQHPHDRLGNYRRQVYSFVQHSSCIMREAYMTHCFKRRTFTRVAHALCVCSTHSVEERLCWHPCGADHSSAWGRFGQRNPIFINIKASRLGPAL